MENRVALLLSAQPEGVARLEANATKTLWRTARVQSSGLSFGNHLGTVEFGNGRA